MGRSLFFGVLLSSVVALHAATDDAVEGATSNRRRMTKILLTNGSDDPAEGEGKALISNSGDDSKPYPFGTNGSDDPAEGEGKALTNNSGDDSKPYPYRVDLLPFTITLRPTLAPLGDEEVDIVQDIAERVIEDYLADVVTFEEGVTFDYLSLLGVDQNQWVVDGSRSRRERRSLKGGSKLFSGHDKDRRLGSAYTVLKMEGGLANFKIVPGSEPPAEELLGAHATEGVSSGLAEALRDAPELASLKDITEAVAVLTDPTEAVVSETEVSGTQPPIPIFPDDGGGKEDEGVDQIRSPVVQDVERSTGRKSNPTGVIAGATVGAAIALLLLALFIRRARKKPVREADPSEHSDFESGELSSSEKSSDFNSIHQHPHALGTIPEDESTADSSSNGIFLADQKNYERQKVEASNEGDEASLGTARSGNTSLASGVPMHPTDSFEIRRQFESISVRKDMIVTNGSSLERKSNRTHAINTERNRQPRTADIEDTRNLMSYPNRIASGSEDSEETWTVGKSKLPDR